MKLNPKTQNFVPLLMTYIFPPMMMLLVATACTDENIFYEALAEGASEAAVSEENNAFNNNNKPGGFSGKTGGAKAFPTAEGAGKFASGGRGGQVIHVTNLNDSGPGSFREAWNTSGARTIVFDVSGTIYLNSYLDTNSSQGDLTIAGQTAPAGGITLEGANMNISDASNIIIRYIRFRRRKAFQGDAFTLWRTSNVILDHCSFAYSSDENVDLANQEPNHNGWITLQRCLVGEGKTGVLIGPTYTTIPYWATVYKNIMASHSHRTPNCGDMTHAEVVNNIIYNWRTRLSRNDGDSRSNYLNNYYKAGPITDQVINAGNIAHSQHVNLTKSTENAKMYLEGNYWEGYPAVTADNWLGWTHTDSQNYKLADQSNLEAQHKLTSKITVPYPILNYQSAQDAYVDVMNDVGANKTLDENGNIVPFIDSVDQTVLDDITNRTYVNISPDGYYEWYYPGDPADFGTIPNNTRPAGFDTDGDGMPNAWEIANGFNPNVADNNGDADGDGYTNLEEYLNEVDKE